MNLCRYRPHDYFKLLAALLPKKFRAEFLSFEDMSDEGTRQDADRGARRDRGAGGERPVGCSVGIDGRLDKLSAPLGRVPVTGLARHFVRDAIR
jgi:hypothetical protein